MGTDSTAALNRAFHDFLKQCQVVDGLIITPIDLMQGIDPTAGGQRLPDQQIHGRPDQKRGQ